MPHGHLTVYMAMVLATHDGDCRNDEHGCGIDGPGRYGPCGESGVGSGADV